VDAEGFLGALERSGRWSGPTVVLRARRSRMVWLLCLVGFGAPFRAGGDVRVAVEGGEGV